MKPTYLKYSQWLKYNVIFFIEHIKGPNFFNNEDSVKNRLNKNVLKELVNNQPSEFKTTIIQNNEIKKNLKSHYLYKGIAKNWPAYKKWNLEYFKNNYGEKEVLIYNTKGVIDPKAPQQSEIITLKKYIEELESGSRKYLKLSSLAQNEKSLQEDLDLKWLRKFKSKFSFGEKFFMFIGGKETLTPMHNEFPTTIYIQVFGTKKWIIYPPEDRFLLNAITERRPYFLSNYIPNSDTNENKLGDFAQKHEVLLEPGDVIVVPPFYWHYVENTSDSIGIAYKYSDIFTSFRSSKVFTILLLLATRPSVFYSFFANRIRKDNKEDQNLTGK